MTLFDVSGIKMAVAVLGKNIWGPGPSSFGRQQRLSEITIEPMKHLGGLGKIWGPLPPGPSLKPPLESINQSINCDEQRFTKFRYRKLII